MSVDGSLSCFDLQCITRAVQVTGLTMIRQLKRLYVKSMTFGALRSNCLTQMQALHDVVKAGYVRYIGMSSCYAYQCGYTGIPVFDLILIV